MKSLTTRFLILLGLSMPTANALAELKAGAAAVDVTPIQFPVLVNGNMLSNSASKATSKLNARAIVLDDGRERIAIVVVDSCMMSRSFLDEAKRLASEHSKIRPERMLISATHTHTAPASMGCLGTDADSAYVPYLGEKLAEAIAAAESNLEPTRVGWAVKNAADFTALRRWIIRPDRIGTDPFGNLTVRANMHAGSNLDNVTGESGPEDPDLSLISFQSMSGRPIAVLANFSMHYFSGVTALNADYFGLFCEGLQDRISKSSDTDRPRVVALMSHGCSGDIWRRDYTKPATASGQSPTIESYTDGLLNIAQSAYEGITYNADANLSMAETRMELKYRIPNQERLQWAQQIVATMGDRLPKTTEEVYAREQILLHERKSTEIVVQAIRVGDIAIATTPNETFALTGLKLKLQSPLPRTMVIELANGGDGYIPPPEQHLLGGYTTWPARSAGLEANAEPRITEAALRLLENVAAQPRRVFKQSRGPGAKAVLQLNPAAYWRLDEFAGPRAGDSSGLHRDAFYEPGVVFFLEGPHSTSFCQDGETNRSAHFAGGRLESRLPDLGSRYSISIWFWNGIPNEGRETSGWMLSRDRNHGFSPNGDHVGIGGLGTDPGKLVFLHGDDHDRVKLVTGRTQIQRWTWNHLIFVRDDNRVSLYLNGDFRPEIELDSPAGFPQSFDQFFFGGRSDNIANWEGRLDEIAVFDRALSEKERSELATSSETTAQP